MRIERYITQTKAGQEQQVRARLALRGIPAIAPRTRRFERRSGQRIVLYAGSAMPGYVFPRATSQQFSMFREVKDACSRPLMVDGKVRPMSTAERARIAEVLRDPPADPRDPHPLGKPDEKKPPFTIGQAVRVISGPFASFGAVVERVWLVSKQWKIRVEVMIFGRPTPVDIDAGALVAA